MKYNYFYKITNTINGHFYYGVHSTNDLEDNYMGSGKALHKAYDKYGMSNFLKEIIKFFDSSYEAFEYEAYIVNEYLIKDKNCYNLRLGGQKFNGSIKGYVTVRYKNGNNLHFMIPVEEYYNNKDIYEFNWQGKHHTLESKNKTRQKLTPKNSTNKKIWINKDGQIKYVLKSKLNNYLNDGWDLGRSGYIPLNEEDRKQRLIEKEKLKEQKLLEKLKLKEQRQIEKDKLKEQKELVKLQKNIIIKEEKIKKQQYYTNAIKSLYQYSNIDFSKFGWVNKAKQYLKNSFDLDIIEPLHKMIKRYYPSFYDNKNIFVRKKPNS